ncbi:hypothetical protein [Cupriavidus sp. IDO]|uniref:hypothetical protein n=1 Tax=Cupriavidus sp. IDO TaxID=1539142 RepID=UPI00308351AC
MMRDSEYSLRRLVDKWLAPTEGSPVRVTCFGHQALRKGSFVCVESTGLSMAFFRHGDGAWYVFPPGV